MKGSNRKSILLGALLAVLAINVSHVSAAQSNKVKSERIKVVKKYNHLKEKANTGEKLRVVVKLKDTNTPKIRHKNKARRKALLSNNNQKIAKLKSHLSRHKIKHIRDLSRLGYMVMEVDSAQLDELVDSGLVDSVIEDELEYTTLSESVPLIGADLAHASGFTGAGQAVVIMDSGFDTSHTSFGGRVVEEACFSNGGTLYTTQTSLCPNGESSQYGTGASTGCAEGANGCRHGTHVASTAAGVNGVAPEANIVTVQVFTQLSDSASGSYPSDTAAALEWVLTKATTDNIASINMSIGSGKSLTNCDDEDIRAKSISDLREAGIATVISSGNGSFTDGVSFPSCISDAITVGSTDKADVLSEFSNSSELVDLLAPGSDIRAAFPGNEYVTLSGTSMAAPHVTGAFAVLRSSDNSATVTTLETMLESTGVDITDTQNNVTKPRIDVNAAIAAIEVAKYAPKVVWPNGTVPVASAAQEAHPVENVGDGDTATRWSAQDAGQTITFDLGGTYTLSEINIAFLKGDSRSTYFDLAISSDGINFTEISTGLQSSGSSTSLESFELSGTAQYVQIVGQGNSSNNWNSLTEVEIFGASTLAFISAPTGLTIDNLAAGEITVSWTDASYSEAGYLVEYARFTEDENVLSPYESKTLAVNSTSTNITGLLEDYYSVRVSAFNGNISSDYVSETVFYKAPDELYIEAISSYSHYTAEQGDKTFSVIANIDWTITSSDSWITVSPATGSSNGSPVVSVTENTSLDERSGNITITGGSFSQTIYLTQAGSTYIIPPTGLILENTASGEITVSWNDTNDNETGYLVKYARHYNDEGDLYSSESVILDANSTHTVITGLLNDMYEVRVYALSDDEQTDYVYKSISAEYLTSTLVTPENLTAVVTASGELTLNWTDLSTGEAGYLVQYNRYYESKDALRPGVEVILPENTTSHVITGLLEDWYYITVSAFDGGDSSNIDYLELVHVQFEEDSLTLSTANLSFVASGASELVSISSSVDWSISDDASWLSASVTSGSNDDDVTFTATENTGTESRYATITVTGGDITQTISVTQEAGIVASEPVQLVITNATASSDDGNEVSNTLDNNFDTRWSANGEGEYVTYDLGAVKSLSSVQAAFYKGDSRNTYFSIAVSDNGTDFTTYLENETSSGAGTSLEEFLISTQARYVRIIGLGNSSNTWNSLTEVQIWGTEL